MAISDNGTRDQYSASASQTVFAYTFEVFVKEDLAVEQNGTLLSEGTHYTVSDVGNDAGGNVTLVTGAILGDIITLYRSMAFERLSDYQQNGEFLANEVNSDLDRLWAALQQNQTNLGASIRPAIDDSILNSSNTELANVATRGGKALGFASDGTLDYKSFGTAGGSFIDASTTGTMTGLSGLSVGDVVQTAEFSTGNGGGGTYDVVLTSGVTPNTYNIIIGVSDPLISFVLRIDEILDAKAYGAPKGITQDARVALESAFNYCRDSGIALLLSGQFRIDAPMTWGAAGGLNPQVIVKFDNARLTKNFNGAGLTCTGGSTMHIHYGDLFIDKMTNLGDGTGANATAGDYGFVQNSRLERNGLIFIENQAGDAYVCQADTNMNGSKLGSVRIRACDGKGFTGTGTQDDCAIWTGDIWTNNCYEAGIFIPDTFNARAWDMTMRGENCAHDLTSDQIYTGGMLGCRITGYAENNTGSSGVEIHIPAVSTNVDFYTWRVDTMTLLSSTSRVTQGNINYTAGNTPTEASIVADNLSDNVARTVTKNWVGSSSANLVKRIIRGSGELSFEVTDRSSSDLMSMDFLPGSGFTFRMQKNGTDEWKVLDGGVARFLGSFVAGGTSSIDSSAVIEARSTTKGFLLPRMNTTQRDAISTPSNGLMVYNTSTNKINVRAGGSWEAVTSS